MYKGTIIMWEPDLETLGLYLGSLYESYYFGAIGPGFLNQVPTLALTSRGRLEAVQLAPQNRRAPRLTYEIFRQDRAAVCSVRRPPRRRWWQPRSQNWASSHSSLQGSFRKLGGTFKGFL